MLSYVKLCYRFSKLSWILCIFFGVKFWICFATVMWLWEVPLFQLHVISLAFDLEMWGVSGKTSGSGELDAEKQLRISVLGKHKKLRFNTYAFPSTMVMGAGNAITFPCHFGIFMRIHVRVSMFLWKNIPNVEILEHQSYRCGTHL